MSMSLRDQLLKAGLVSKKQVNEVERQQERLARHPPRKGGAQGAPQGAGRAASGAGGAASGAPAGSAANSRPGGRPAAPVPAPGARAAAEKAARDLALNRKQQEKAQRRAKHAEIKQLIAQNRLPPIEGGDPYNFVDGTHIRKIPVDAAARARLIAGTLVIVRHEGRYDLVEPATAARIAERDPGAVMPAVVPENTPIDEAYREFPVPDDLNW